MSENTRAQPQPRPLDLPLRNPGRRREALERIAGQLAAKSGIGPEDVVTKSDLLSALRRRDVQTQTKWGVARFGTVADLLEHEDWSIDGAMPWLRTYGNKERASKQRRERMLEAHIVEYIAEISEKEVGSIEQLTNLLETSKDDPPFELSSIPDGITVNLKSATDFLRGADAEAISRIIKSVNERIREGCEEERMRREVQSLLEVVAEPFDVNVLVDELSVLGKRHFGIKIYIGYGGDLLEFHGSFDRLKRDLESMVREVAEDMAADVVVCPFCGEKDRRDHLMRRGSLSQNQRLVCACDADIVIEHSKDMDGGSDASEALWRSGCEAVGRPVPEHWRRIHIDDIFANVKYAGKGDSGWRIWFLKMPWALEPNRDMLQEPLPSSPKAMNAVGTMLVKREGFGYFEWEIDTPHEGRNEFGRSMRLWGVEKEASFGRVLVSFEEYDHRFEVGFSIGLLESHEYQEAVARDEDPYDILIDKLGGYMTKLLGFEILIWYDPDKETEIPASIELKGENYEETVETIISMIKAVGKNAEQILAEEKRLLEKNNPEPATTSDASPASAS